MNPPTEPTLSFSMDLFKSDTEEDDDDNPGYIDLLFFLKGFVLQMSIMCFFNRNSKKNVSGGLKRGRKPSKIGKNVFPCFE